MTLVEQNQCIHKKENGHAELVSASHQIVQTLWNPKTSSRQWYNSKAKNNIYLSKIVHLIQFILKNDNPMKTSAITLFAALLFASCGEQAKKETTEKEEEKTTKETEASSAPKLRHVVLFKFKETSSAEEVKQVEEAFNALPSKIDLIREYEWGTNNSPENLNKELTHCYFLTFDNEADRDTYLTHPDHVAFGDIAGPHIADVTVVDYWTK